MNQSNCAECLHQFREQNGETTELVPRSLRNPNSMEEASDVPNLQVPSFSQYGQLLLAWLQFWQQLGFSGPLHYYSRLPTVLWLLLFPPKYLSCWFLQAALRYQPFCSCHVFAVSPLLPVSSSSRPPFPPKQLQLREGGSPFLCKARYILCFWIEGHHQYNADDSGGIGSVIRLLLETKIVLAQYQSNKANQSKQLNPDARNGFKFPASTDRVRTLPSPLRPSSRCWCFGHPA